MSPKLSNPYEFVYPINRSERLSGLQFNLTKNIDFKFKILNLNMFLKLFFYKNKI